MKVTIKVSELPNGAFRALCPSLPGCVAHGHSNEEVTVRMKEAVLEYLASFDAPAGTAVALLSVPA